MIDDNSNHLPDPAVPTASANQADPAGVGGILVRPAVEADVPGIARLERACFPDPWSEASLRRDLAGNTAAHYLTAIAPDNQLIGYIIWWQVFDEAEIINLAVSPGQRGQGVGRLLLHSMIGEACRTGASVIHLDVRESNQPARRLYDRAGFQQTGLRVGYYANDRENAITMLKRLT